MLPSNSGEVQAVTRPWRGPRLSMKICCLPLPPTLVKSPMTRSRVPLWLIAWL